MGFFDTIRGWFGTSSTPLPPTQLAGSDGVSAPGGYLWRGERDPELVGRRLWLQFSDAIANSIVVSAAARYFLNLTAGTEWEAQPRDPTALGAGARKDAQRAADILTEGLFEADMARPWSAIVRKHALYKFYGFAISEWAVKQRADGMVVFSAIEHRPQYTIQWWDKIDEQEPLQGVVQLTRIGKTYYIPRQRMFYCVDDTLTDSPDGIGMMRHLIGHVKRLQKYEQLEGIGFESDLRGIPLSRAPISDLQSLATSANKPAGWVEEQVQPLVDFGRAHLRTEDLSMVLDSAPYKNPDGTISSVPKWAMDLMKGDGGPLEQVAAAINRVNTEIARVLGAEFMMMGSTSSGSHSMHADKTDQFGNLIQSTLGELAAFAKNDLARPLVALNGLDPDLLTPTLLPGAVSTEEVSQVTTSLLQLAQAGAPLMPGDPAIDQIRARLHLAAQPKITPDVAGVLGKPKPQPTPPDPAEGEMDVDVSGLGETS